MGGWRGRRLRAAVAIAAGLPHFPGTRPDAGVEGTAMIIEEMSRQECLDLLSTARQGRLACVSEGQPYVVPITFSLDGNYLYSFSMLGRKVEWMRAHPKVCVQADEFGADRGWRSVVVFGTYEELPDRVGWKRDRDRAWSL